MSQLQKKETERKFILRNVPDLKFSESIFIVQDYIRDSEDKFIRLRESRKMNEDGSIGLDSIYELIWKESISSGENIEHDLTVDGNIDPKKFFELRNSSERRIEKIRNVYELNNVKYEIDKFIYINLVMLEIEVDKISDEIFIPEEIEKQIICEVTHLPGNPFGNFNIAYKK